MNKINEARSQLVVKDNRLIQNARYQLTVTQQKLIAYVISLIKPTDKEFTRYEISIADFCELCGIDKRYFYSEIKEIIDNLDDKQVWMETEEKVFKFRWFSEVEIVKGSGKVRLILNSNIQDYLLNLSKEFTTYELFNILALRGKYSIRLYEWFKSYSYLKEKTIDINELKIILDTENYKDFKSFRRRVIEPAIEEINKYTDLNVSYDKITKNKNVTALIFYIRFKAPAERLQSQAYTVEQISKRNKQIAGQLALNFEEK